ncbi:uncharacterized protein LOC144037582 [Vanacampus margaritifer]
MSTADTWNDGVTLACLSNKERSGSHDSVISMNSAFSEDSMEYLSAEERACLMYLEQTIEALEVQEDSGLSNDEPDSGHLPWNTGRNTFNDISGLNLKSEMDQRSESSPTLLAGFPVEKKPVYITLTEENIVKHHLLNQTCEPNFTTASEDTTEELGASMNGFSQAQLPVTGCNIPLDMAADALCLPPIDDSPNTITCMTPNLDLGLIPPPSDFMDCPGPDPDPDPELDLEPDPEADNINNSGPVSIDLNRLYQRALDKKLAVSPPVRKKAADKLLMEAGQRLPALETLLPVSRHPEATEPRSPPLVAPKPKRPSVKSPYCTQTEESNSPVGNGDEQPLDREIIHLQALQKLGLLKRSATDSGPALNSKLTPPTRKSWANLSSPSSPSRLSPSNLTPVYRSMSVTSSLSPPSATPPVSSAIGDSARLLLSAREQSPANNISASSMYSQVKSPTPSPSDLVKQLTKVTAAQPGATEHSGLRPSRTVDHERISVERCLSHAASPDFRRRASSHSALQQSKDSHMLPRSQGISVLICPRDANGVERREALKKLGLIRD